ncbi:glycoside hydrolase family 3 C-terminal domain-containing protein [Nonomuraea sp. NPDC049129]|uniref:glycoside hydrolase family 3 protein n=1 Tax=Nonomuraea sp. NPDC049129 TaxID=3155272 RepID=UPI0033E2C462
MIGELARTPRFQGAGCPQVNPVRVDNALEALELLFEPGYLLSGKPDATLLDAAVAAAAAAEVVVVFLGLPEGEESEGLDRRHLDLPAVQLDLLKAIAEANQNVVVVLANGGVVEVASWQHHAKAVLEGWLAGQAGGGALADLLFGRANPCGRLAETIPLRLQDTPAYLDYPGSNYGERLYVGYRYYDAKDMPVAYPSGHGLSYTTFAYSDLRTEVDGDTVRVRLTLTNTGPVTGHRAPHRTDLPGDRRHRRGEELRPAVLHRGRVHRGRWPGRPAARQVRSLIKEYA